MNFKSRCQLRLTGVAARPTYKELWTGSAASNNDDISYVVTIASLMTILETNVAMTVLTQGRQRACRQR